MSSLMTIFQLFLICLISKLQKQKTVRFPDRLLFLPDFVITSSQMSVPYHACLLGRFGRYGGRSLRKY